MSDGCWMCHDCRLCTFDETVAIGHADEHDHWLYLHPGSFRGHPPIKSIHASDWGGCYVDDVTTAEGQGLARRWRDRIAVG